MNHSDSVDSDSNSNHNNDNNNDNNNVNNTNDKNNDNNNNNNSTGGAIENIHHHICQPFTSGQPKSGEGEGGGGRMDVESAFGGKDTHGQNCHYSRCEHIFDDDAIEWLV